MGYVLTDKENSKRAQSSPSPISHQNLAVILILKVLCSILAGPVNGLKVQVSSNASTSPAWLETSFDICRTRFL